MTEREFQLRNERLFAEQARREQQEEIARHDAKLEALRKKLETLEITIADKQVVRVLVYMYPQNTINPQKKNIHIIYGCGISK